MLTRLFVLALPSQLGDNRLHLGVHVIALAAHTHRDATPLASRRTTVVVPSGRIPGAGDPGEQPFRLLGEFTLRRRNQDLSVNALQEIGDCLAMGGLCIAPSDSGFALVANPFVRNTTTIIDTILERKQEKVPLSFASLPMIERYAVNPAGFHTGSFG